MSEEKNGRAKAIEIALGQIEKQFGKGSIIRLGSSETVEVPAIPTGSVSLDAALGVGGLPRGRVVEQRAGRQAVPSGSGFLWSQPMWWDIWQGS